MSSSSGFSTFQRSLTTGQNKIAFVLEASGRAEEALAMVAQQPTERLNDPGDGDPSASGAVLRTINRERLRTGHRAHAN